MNAIKKIFKYRASRIWAIVAMSFVVFSLVVSIVLSTVLYDVMVMVFGAATTSGRGDTMYYEPTAASKEEAFTLGNAFNEKVCEEGFVLLKNKDNAALPLTAEETKVSVFGKNSVNLVYGGSGSAGGRSDGAKTIYDSLTAAGFQYNGKLKSFYESSDSGTGRGENPAIEDIENGDAELITGETPWSSYNSDVTGSFAEYDDVAIVVLSRIGGEGFDLPRTKSGHYLQLDANEKAMLEQVTNAGFGKVIVLINSSNVMEIAELENNEKIDAIMHIGGPGLTGIMALGRILNGTVTPSAHTVDTWATDFAMNPAWYNLSNNMEVVKEGVNVYTGDQYKNNGEYVNYYFVDYEEGIYVGYRYYETRYATYNGAVTAIGETEYANGEAWYDANVVYPFGFGLSYTEFAWEIENEDELKNLQIADTNKNEDIEIKVKVTNTGDRSGKEVVQLYAAAPYTANGIEKSSVVLCGFAKTPELYPADEATAEKPNSCVVTIKFNPYDIASYDYSDANGNGFKGYELEEGGYTLNLQTDSHSKKQGVETIAFDVQANGVTYGVDPTTNNTVENRFDDADDQLDILLSRTDWANTWPTTPNTKELKNYSTVTLDMLKSTEHNNPTTEFENYTTDAEVTVKLIELKGLDYDDEKWEALLDSLSFNEMLDLYNKGAFGKIGIERIGLPATIEADGPVGFANFVSDVDIYGTVWYASKVIHGSTWNVEISKAYGEHVGDEGIYGKQKVDPAIPYSGWYAPGLNIHRTPFGGRNCEYFSEDAFLSGTMAAAEIKGTASKGVYTYMKHFALNEQETHRDANGIATWATEQSMREIYLKAFEIAVKDGEATGIMSSFNRIGTRWTGGDYRLLTEVLRNEWGFEGTVICDFNVSPYMNTKQMAYAGGNLNLTTTRPWRSASASNVGDVAILRNAAHNNLYTTVNSNAMNGIDADTNLTSNMATWQIVIFVIIAVGAVGIAIWGVFAVRGAFKKKR